MEFCQNNRLVSKVITFVYLIHLTLQHVVAFKIQLALGNSIAGSQAQEHNPTDVTSIHYIFYTIYRLLLKETGSHSPKTGILTYQWI